MQISWHDPPPLAVLAVAFKTFRRENGGSGATKVASGLLDNLLKLLANRAAKVEHGYRLADECSEFIPGQSRIGVWFP
jgi:hypothetical protein